MTKQREHNAALEMRKDGKPLGEISKTLGISKGTASLWCNDIKLSPEQITLNRKNAQPRELRLKNLKIGRSVHAKNIQTSHAWNLSLLESILRETPSRMKHPKSKRDTINRYSIKRRLELKRKCVEYKGGSCKCGYNKCLSAMEFHHRNQNEKDFPVSLMMRASIPWEKIREELDKCDLVCANCHREKHEEILAEKYKIKNGCVA